MPSTPRDLDAQVRAAAFRFLDEQQLHSEAVAYEVLKRGFEFRGQIVKLIGPQGIFKPRILTDYPLSISTAPAKPGQKRPYDDGFRADGSLIYRYRGVDPSHPDNVRLRTAMRDRIPLIYFHGVVPARYLAVHPAYVIGDEPRELAFHVDLDGRLSYEEPDRAAMPELAIERRYSIRTTRQRLHQTAFRERVLAAYRRHCAICRLRHEDLLDAAHIVPDADPEGEPVVSNGLSLCKLHHAAFDARLFGIRPDLVVEVKAAILGESDGPMLVHGLQSIHDTRIYMPRRSEWRPDERALQIRYEEFCAARGV